MPRATHLSKIQQVWWLEWTVLLFFFLRCEENGKWLAGINVTWVLQGTYAIAKGHQTSSSSIFEGTKTLNCEKKPWETSTSGCFGRGRRILAPQSKSDKSTCEKACAMCCCGSTFLGKVVLDFISCTIKRICELIMPHATQLSRYSKFDGWNGLFYFFFALWGKWHWIAGMHVTWVLWGTLAIARGHHTSL